MAIKCGNDLFKTGLVTGLNVADTIREAQEFNLNESGVIKQASLVNRLVMLGLNITEVSLLVTQQDAKVLERLKQFECLSTDTNIPLQLFRGIQNLDLSINGMVNFLDQAIVTPLSQAVYTHAEQNKYSLQAFLDEHSRELGDKRSIVEKELAECQRAADQALQARLAAKVVSTVSSSAQVQERYLQLSRIYALSFSPDLDQEEAFDLVKLTYIPEVLHEAFQEHVCPITLCPIRDPVRDPTATGENPVYYERGAIVNYLSINEISPMTRQPLKIGQLVECPELKAATEVRLQQFQDELMEFLSEQAALEVD